MKFSELLIIFSAMLFIFTANSTAADKYRLFVVSSYHREYMWTQHTQEGLCAGLMKYGFMDSIDQADTLTKNDYVETSTSVIKKVWMDTKRKNSEQDIFAVVNKIVEEINAFAPDLIFLGDDNAANYIGNQFIDTNIAIVFWGINGMPAKYGLIESLESPGHNITGVYQKGYLKECLEFLKHIVPSARTFAVLSDDSETGRSKAKQLENLDNAGELPMRLAGCVVTNSFEEWKSKALELQKKVDAFFILNHSTICDANGTRLNELQVAAWYLQNINKPECSHEKQFAEEGILCVCDDSGFNQAYEAVKLAEQILKRGQKPGSLAVYAPPRGPFIINLQRAEMLGIKITNQTGADQYIEKCLALEEYPVIGNK